MKSLRNEINNLFGNTHVRIKIYQEFCHDKKIYRANEGHHVRKRQDSTCSTLSIFMVQKINRVGTTVAFGSTTEA